MGLEFMFLAIYSPQRTHSMAYGIQQSRLGKVKKALEDRIGLI